MAAGRKRKPGARTKSGALKRDHYPAPVYDRGSDWVQAQRQRYGEDYSSALGRAYAAGLIGTDAEAKERYDAGKRFARLYARLIDTRPYRCALDRSVPGASATEHDRARNEQDWLFAAMATLDKARLRPWLDELLGKQHTDAGPVWLTRLLMGGRAPYDRQMMAEAIKALDMLR